MGRYFGMARWISTSTVLGVVALLSFAAAPSAARDPSTGLVSSTSAANVQAACPAATPGNAQCFALRRTDIRSIPGSAMTPFTVPSGYGPADIQSAYNLPSATAGTGMTVAVVDAFDLPTAEADLAAYRTQYGLPACTVANACFQKVNQNGLTSPLPAPDAGWGTEIALDIDMVSAACPNCNILLVEANSNSYANLTTAVDTAASMGAMAVSNSYGGPEFSGQTSLDSHYNHPGVAVTVSTGDCGYDCSGNFIGVSWPASSPNVVAVGGTNLTHDASTRGWTESAWGVALSGQGAGSGCSLYESKPSWQHDASCTNCMNADVSAVADPATGVAVYDNGAWIVVGGTSASSPIIAGVYALAGLPGAGSYPASYLYADTADLYDVTSGNNNVWGSQIICPVTYYCNGVTGYDGPTGLGTPNGVHAFVDPTLTTHLGVSGFPNPTAPGASHTLTVTAKNAANSTATSYLGTVHFTSSDSAAVLPADYTFTAGDLGVHVFNVTLNTVGTRSVTATDTLTSSITGAQTGIVVGTVTRQPDGRIRLGTTGALVGDNIYNSTGLNQSQIGSAKRGKTITFTISAQNDGSAADHFTVLASGTASSAYTVTYFHGTTNITAAVVAGTYTTPSVKKTKAYVITVKVKVKSSATVGSSVSRLVTFTSVGDGTKQDVVGFTGKRS